MRAETDSHEEFGTVGPEAHTRGQSLDVRRTILNGAPLTPRPEALTEQRANGRST